MRHFAYAAGWKKFEPLWDLVMRAKRVAHMRPVLERVLLPDEVAQASRPARRATAQPQRIDLATRSTSDISLKVFSP